MMNYGYAPYAGQWTQPMPFNQGGYQQQPTHWPRMISVHPGYSQRRVSAPPPATPAPAQSIQIIAPPRPEPKPAPPQERHWYQKKGLLWTFGAIGLSLIATLVLKGQTLMDKGRDLMQLFQNRKTRKQIIDDGMASAVDKLNLGDAEEKRKMIETAVGTAVEKLRPELQGLISPDGQSKLIDKAVKSILDQLQPKIDALLSDKSKQELLDKAADTALVKLKPYLDQLTDEKEKDKLIDKAVASALTRLQPKIDEMTSDKGKAELVELMVGKVLDKLKPQVDLISNPAGREILLKEAAGVLREEFQTYLTKTVANPATWGGRLRGKLLGIKA